MNNCTFNGRLTKDPELKTTQRGKKYTRFCLAVKRRVKSGDHPQSDFIDCIAWDKTAEIITQYCSKGSQLGVVGRLQTNVYENNGEKRKSFDIVVLDVDLIGGGKSSSSQTEETAPQTDSDEYIFDPNLPFQV